MKKLLSALLPALALLMAAFWFTHCKDIRIDDLPTSPSVQVTFAGEVTDENGAPIANATVQAGNQTALTDERGIFRLKPVSLPEKNAILRISATNYFDFTRAYVVEDGALRTVKVQLLQKNIAGSLSANSGGTLQVDGKVTLNFPANAIVKADGSAFTGTFSAYARYLDPDAPNLLLQMPGDLRGLRVGGAEEVLTTYGMVGVELVDGSGQALQIKPGEQVEISMTIAASQQSTAPASIPLWHFDADQARWIEEGQAQRMGDRYVGKVGHFSWWNCDISGPLVTLQGHVYSGDLQQPLANVHVWICPTGTPIGYGCGHGTSDAEGFFGGGAPKDVPLTLSIQGTGNCAGQILYSEDIGTFSSDAVLPDIILTNLMTKSLTVTGRVVDCNGQPVADGYVSIKQNGSKEYAFTDANGAFNYTLSCALGSGTVEVKGYDINQLLESPAATLSAAASPVDAGDLAACSALSEYIRYSIDGGANVVIVDFLYGGYFVPRTFINGSSSSGYFQMRFDNNGQTGTFPLTSLAVGQDSSSTVSSVTTTLTAFGNVGDFLIGTFMGTYQDLGTGLNHTLSGDYRVKRAN